MTVFYSPSAIAEVSLDSVFNPEGWEADQPLPLTAEESFNLNGFDDEDYVAGWGVSKAEAMLELDCFDCFSSFDSNDYEYQQALYN